MNPQKHNLLPEKPYDSYRSYLDATGGSAVRAAWDASPEEVLDRVRRSGLRGRGGAGFPTGAKWASVRNHSCRKRYVVCNAAEGEPGTFKDRFLLRKNPYATLEGMAIAAHAVGARAGYIALKASFRREIERVRAAIDEMQVAGLLDGFSLTVLEGPEEYLFGEEKALLNVIEGIGPLPRTPDEPPYEIGLFATPDSPNPAVVNNAETFAHVPSIVRPGGSASFRSIGTSDTPGTLLLTVCGDVARPGVYELPAGITMRHLLHEVAGGPRPGRTFKLVLSGVSTGVLVPEQFDTPIEFGALALAGSGLGSGGFVVYDDQISVSRVAQAMTRFLYVESCNQCWACKTNLRIASNAFDELFKPGASRELLDRALIGAQHAPQGNRCYLPVEASILIPSLLKRFKGEFEEQAAHGAADSREVVVPKIVDYDEERRVFVYDDAQARKRPDWTYEQPSPWHELPGRQPAAPAPRAHGPVTIRLAPDLAEVLEARARLEHREVDQVVDAALRAWLETPTAPPG